MYTVKKKSNKQLKAKSGVNPSLSANTQAMDVEHISAKTGGSVGNLSAKDMGSFSAIATLRAAKKKPKLEADVTFGPTEVKEEAQMPRNDKYLERLKKRAK